MPARVSGTVVVGTAANAVVKAWLASRFTTDPQYDTSLPAGAPDAGPINTGVGAGSEGAWVLTLPTAADYWISAEFNGHIAWELRAVGPVGQGVPAGGTTGQALVKNSYADFDTVWRGGDISGLAYIVPTGGTIPTASLSISRVAPSGPVTGVLMQPGTFTAQAVWVVNEATVDARTITFDVQNLSRVQGNDSGAPLVLGGRGSRFFVWNPITQLWHPAA